MSVARSTLLEWTCGALVTACWLTGCGGGQPAAPAAGDSPAAGAPAATSGAPIAAATKAKPRPKAEDPIVVLRTTAGEIQVQLFREKAPQTVDNFLRNYAERQFYDGTIFHHVEAGSMIIGGGYAEDLTAKETRSPIFNESQNRLLNKRGAVAMIRQPDNAHSATSQFFINLADNPALDCQSDMAQLTYSTEAAPGEASSEATREATREATADAQQTDEAWGYCVFGQVIAGLDVVDRIGTAQVAAEGDFPKLPVERIAIQSIQRIR